MTGRARLVSAVAAALCAQVTYRVAMARIERRAGGADRWRRTNHAGRPVTLLAGPALVAGAATTALAPGAPGRVRAAAGLAILGAGAVGAYDDLGERRGVQAKGVTGHLQAVRSGRVTSGAVKAVGIGAVGTAAAALLAPRPGRAVLGGAVVAGYANLINLFDLRPGRAIKVALVHAPGLLDARAGAVLAAPLGAAAALLPADLRAQAMLGDTGANALGAALGVAVLARYGPVGQAAHLAGLVALTAASERVSFTEVIAATPVLRRLDEWGR